MNRCHRVCSVNIPLNIYRIGEQDSLAKTGAKCVSNATKHVMRMRFVAGVMPDDSPDMGKLRDLDGQVWTNAFSLLWRCAKYAAAIPGLSVEDIEEVASDAIKAAVPYVVADKVATFQKLKGLVATIAHKRRVSLFRTIVKGPSFEPIEAMEQETSRLLEIKSDNPGNPSDLEWVELAIILDGLLRQVGEPCRSLLLGHFCDGKISNELAQELSKEEEGKVSPGAIRKRIFDCLIRARKKLDVFPELAKHLRDFLR